MTLFLSNPASQAHLDDLRGRLTAQLSCSPLDKTTRGLLVDRLVAVVQTMDKGQITTRDALDTFEIIGVPGFSFGRWLIEMVDEDVYLDAVFDNAA
jgi:hypothetical protein